MIRSIINSRSVMVSQRKVLIIDDNAEDRYAYRRYLQQDENWDYIILEAESAREAIALCEREQPDGILLDYLLPDATGLSVLAELQTYWQTESLPAIVLTGQGSEEIAVRAMKSGAQDYLVKGQLTPKTLRLALDAVIVKAQLYNAQAALRYRIERERLVAEMAQRIRQTLNVAEVTHKTVDEVREFLKCDRAFIYRFNDDFSGTIEVESVDPGWPSIISTAVTDSYFADTSGRDYLNGRIQAIADVYTANLTECHIELLERFHIRANLAVPILQGKKLWGLLVANQCSQPRQWQPLEIDLLCQLATQVGIAIQQSEYLQQMQIAREEAERANRVKDEFLAVLSHELRTPLSPILGWSQLLRSGRLDPAKTHDALATIERNAKLQSQLIEDLLDISRILSGKLILQEVDVVDLAVPIAAALETVALAAAAKQISIETSYPAIPAIVRGDAARLQQIFWNLLSNAVKFTPTGGQVAVRLETIGTHAKIEVSDTGKGINPNFLPHVFDYFQQEDSATTRKFGGLGLGLAIVRQLVELHGGTVSVASAGEDRGTSLTISLPLDATSSASANVPSAVDRHSATLLAGLKVLVIDDDVDSRELIAFVLQSDGACVRACSGAIDALQEIDRFHPDILVSDIGMPELDGYELLRQLRLQERKHGGCIPAIALTAYAGSFDRDRAIAAGFQQHLSKPIDPDELTGAVAHLAGR